MPFFNSLTINRLTSFTALSHTSASFSSSKLPKMESQSKTIMSGIENNNNNNNNNNNVGVKPRRKVRAVDLVIRLLALALTLTSAIILGVDKQTKVVPFQFSPNLPPLNIPLHAKSRYLSAFVYSMVASSIACAYAAVSLLLLLMKRGGNTGTLELMIMVADMVVTALLFSSNGAAAAIGLMGFKGNTKVRWNKVCNVFERFCHQVAASLALSLIGALAFLLLVVLASVHLHRKAK